MKEYPKLLIADKNRKIYDIPFLEATGMKAGEYFRLDKSELIKVHSDGELFMLPARKPVGYDPESGEFIRLDKDPLQAKTRQCYAVAAFLPPGYTATYNASFVETKKVSMLPLFSYAPVAYYKGEFYTTGIRVDREKRQALKEMKISEVKKNVKAFRKIFPDNRLVRHLEKCALIYSCPAAKNFFLKRYEGPLPSSPVCNARCIGCISHQPGKGCSVTQPRIEFVPSAEEIAEAALFHIREVRDPVVSFGQGCEGEPLMVGDVLEKAVRLIRVKTGKGIINLNTNASKPDVIKRLFDAGLDSIRVSMNSVRESCYNSYYKPQKYGFKDVIKSIKAANKAGGFVSVNYLVMPGFTDSVEEVEALMDFLSKIKIDMIQWRNLNYDPVKYFKEMKICVRRQDMTGVDVLIRTIEEEFPGIMKGYFNPSAGRIKRGRVK